MNGKAPGNFTFKRDRVAENMLCPACGHPYVQKLKSDDEFKEEKREATANYKKKQKAHGKKPGALKKDSGAPRLRLPGRTFMCPCLILKGKKCPHCNGRSKTCQICNCKCNCGPFQLGDMEAISRRAQSDAIGLEENTAPRTVVDNRDSFVSNMIRSIQLGSRDLRASGVEETSDNVAGAAAHYLAQAPMTDDERHSISLDIGEPTTQLSEGLDVSDLQGARRDNRYYNNGLGNIFNASRSSRASLPPASTRRGNSRRGNSRTPPPPNHQRQMSRSSSSTLEERKTATRLRVFKHVKTRGVELQTSGTPGTKKRRKKRVSRELASDGNNEVKMMVDCEAVAKTPEPGMSQKLAVEILNRSDSDTDDDDSRSRKKSRRRRKKKKKKKEKKKEEEDYSSDRSDED